MYYSLTQRERRSSFDHITAAIARRLSKRSIIIARLVCLFVFCCADLIIISWKNNIICRLLHEINYTVLLYLKSLTLIFIYGHKIFVHSIYELVSVFSLHINNTVRICISKFTLLSELEKTDTKAEKVDNWKIFSN